MRVGGIVLCGGVSARMGRPKAWLPVGGEVMLQRVVRLLRGAVGPVVVVAAPGQDVPPLPDDFRVVRDEVEGRGPLQGLAAGLAALGGEADAAYLSACDAPLLRPAFVRRMVEPARRVRRLRPDRRRAGPAAGGGVPGVGARGGAGMLAADRRAVWGLLDTVPTRLVRPAELADVDPRLDSLRNVNTLAAYEGVLRELGLVPSPPASGGEG